MRWSGASGITTRFQELFRCTGQVGHALLTRSPLSPRQQAARDPVRLACVKHAASVHPEPESNPPQKTLQKAKNDSQIHFKRNQTDPPNKEREPHKKPPPSIKTRQDYPHETMQADNGTGIIKDDQEPQRPRQPKRHQPWSSSTVHAIEFSNHHHTPTTPTREPRQAVSGSKRKTYTTTPTHATPPPTTHPQTPTNTTPPPACRKPNTTPPKPRRELGCTQSELHKEKPNGQKTPPIHWSVVSPGG